MVNKKDIAEYRKWLHEKVRAQKLGKPNYEKNCDTEIARLEKEKPGLLEVKDALVESIKGDKFDG